jgi:EAL and modified HD-GYP domain-containing signal transduction protein
VDAFVARQPIFDRARRTYAYELLFRAGRTEHGAPGGDPDQASIRVLDIAYLLLGIERVTGGRPAFVNFTRDTLVKGYASIAPGSSIVVEILESVVADAEVLEACRRLSEAGHLIALDDVVCDQVSPELLEVADIVKVDFVQNGPQERRRLVEQLRPRGLKLLAEKVETEEDWRQAFEAGYDYFQGYFFSRPVIIAGREVPASRLNLLRLLHRIHQPDADLGQVESIIRHEVSLTLKLLTYMNLTAFGLRQPVSSIRQALLLLGVNGVRKWASVVALASAGGDRPFELVVTSVVRARFCELLAQRAGGEARAEDGFFAGLFSLLDAILGRPLPELLDTLPIGDDVRRALLGQAGALRGVLDVVLAYERGAWDAVARLAAAHGLDERAVAEAYVTAVAWGNSTASMEAPAA